METDDTVMLILNYGELSALSYLIAFAAENHPKLTQHEKTLIDKVSTLDEDAFTLWRAALIKAAQNK